MTTQNKKTIDYYQVLNLGPRWIRRDLLQTVSPRITPPSTENVAVLPLPPQQSTLINFDSIPSIQNVATPCEELALTDWDQLEEKVRPCQLCPLSQHRTQTVFGTGVKDAPLMIIGEAPGAEEDKQGLPFVGQAGKLLDNMLATIAHSRQQNVYIANVLKCRPPKNRNPEAQEVATCSPYLKQQIALVKPRLILAVGRFAVNSLLNTDAPISALRGHIHRYQEIPVIVSYHPAYLLRNLPDKFKAWQDLLLVQKTLAQQSMNKVAEIIK